MINSGDYGSARCAASSAGRLDVAQFLLEEGAGASMLKAEAMEMPSAPL